MFAGETLRRRSVMKGQHTWKTTVVMDRHSLAGFGRCDLCVRAGMLVAAYHECCACRHQALTGLVVADPCDLDAMPGFAFEFERASRAASFVGLTLICVNR